VKDITFGLNAFGDRFAKPAGGLATHPEAIRQVLDEAILADQVGVDAFLAGEHHRQEYSISAPEVVLAGIATRTERLRLGSGVTVLSSDDPVRVYERFATLDAMAEGRVDVVLGRGSFIESFPLFGYDLTDYEELFEEKLDLFHQLMDEKPVTWSGTKRASLTNADVFPKTAGGLTAWVGVGGSPQSVVRTAQHGFPLMLAIIGGAPDRFAPYVDLYHRAAAQLGTEAKQVGMHSPGFIAETDEEAVETTWPHYEALHNRLGSERGWGPTSRAQYESEVAHGSQYVGSPETVARRIADAVEVLGVDRFDMVYDRGTLPAEARLRSVELFGTVVIPRVRELLAERAAA